MRERARGEAEVALHRLGEGGVATAQPGPEEADPALGAGQVALANDEAAEEEGADDEHDGGYLGQHGGEGQRRLVLEEGGRRALGVGPHRPGQDGEEVQDGRQEEGDDCHPRRQSMPGGLERRLESYSTRLFFVSPAGGTAVRTIVAQEQTQTANAKPAARQQ